MASQFVTTPRYEEFLKRLTTPSSLPTEAKHETIIASVMLRFSGQATGVFNRKIPVFYSSLVTAMTLFGHPVRDIAHDFRFALHLWTLEVEVPETKLK